MNTLTRPALLSLLWLFVLLNFIYCDVIGLHDPVLLNSLIGGHAGGLEITPGFLLASSILMEIPISMVLVTRLAHRTISRPASLAAACFMIVVQSASLFVGVPSLAYVFFSVIEIATLIVIAVQCARWTATAGAVTLDSEVAV